MQGAFDALRRRIHAESDHTGAGGVRSGGPLRLHSSVDLSESLGRGQLPPVFALAAGLPRRGFRVRNFTYDEGRSCDAVLAPAARALPIVTKRGVPPAESISIGAPAGELRPPGWSSGPRSFRTTPVSPYKKVTLQNTNPVAGQASSDVVAAPVTASTTVPTVSGVAFTDLGLSDTVLKALTSEGYVHPTPIQQKAIPEVLAGRDLLGCAQTGTRQDCGLRAADDRAPDGLEYAAGRTPSARARALANSRAVCANRGKLRHLRSWHTAQVRRDFRRRRSRSADLAAQPRPRRAGRHSRSLARPDEPRRRLLGQGRNLGLG